jgi:hypothetical protein
VEVTEEARSQGDQEALPDPRGEVFIEEGDYAAEDRQAEVDQYYPSQDAEVFGETA